MKRSKRPSTHYTEPGIRVITVFFAALVGFGLKHLGMSRSAARPKSIRTEVFASFWRSSCSCDSSWAPPTISGTSMYGFAPT